MFFMYCAAAKQLKQFTAAKLCLFLIILDDCKKQIHQPLRYAPK